MSQFSTRGRSSGRPDDSSLKSGKQQPERPRELSLAEKYDSDLLEAATVEGKNVTIYDKVVVQDQPLVIAITNGGELRSSNTAAESRQQHEAIAGDLSARIASNAEALSYARILATKVEYGIARGLNKTALGFFSEGVVITKEGAVVMTERGPQAISDAKANKLTRDEGRRHGCMFVSPSSHSKP